MLLTLGLLIVSRVWLLVGHLGYKLKEIDIHCINLPLLLWHTTINLLALNHTNLFSPSSRSQNYALALNGLTSGIEELQCSHRLYGFCLSIFLPREVVSCVCVW
jgi:hypothetical protein